MSLPAPKVVSPLIRFSRYTALLGGIMYGSYRFKSLSKREADMQQRDAANKEKREKRLAEEKAHNEKVELDNLAVDIGLTKA